MNGVSVRRTPHARRLIGSLLLALSGALVWALPGQVTTAVRLVATYALEGTNFPVFYVPTDEETRQTAVRWIGGSYGDPPLPVTVVNYPASLRFISPGFLSDPPYDESAAAGLAELQRVANGDPAPVIFGFSQGAGVGTLFKRAFNEQFANAPAAAEVPSPTWVFFGNVNRPNGGLFSRFNGLQIPGLGVTFNGATPTQTAGASDGQITTYDISGQYDPASDLPTWALNPLSDLNAVLGLYFVHLLTYQNADMSDAVLQDRYGDTAYYLVPTARLPLTQLLGLVGIPDPLLAVLDAPLRVLVEAGYDRTISPGQPTAMGLIPAVDPLAVARNFLLAIPTGMDDGLQEVGLGRPFGTTPAGPYGVGGPDVTLPGNIPAVPMTQSTSSEPSPEPDASSSAVPSIPTPELDDAPAGSNASTPATAAAKRALIGEDSSEAEGRLDLPTKGIHETRQQITAEVETTPNQNNSSSTSAASASSSHQSSSSAPEQAPARAPSSTLSAGGVSSSSTASSGSSEASDSTSSSP